MIQSIDKENLSYIMKRIKILIYFAALMISLTSCFTGVEGTKKISLTKEDIKNIKPTEEDLFLSSVKGDTLRNWKIGKRFVAADNKTLMTFDQEGLGADLDETAIGGDTLVFKGVEKRMSAGGIQLAFLRFDHKGNNYYYNTGKDYETALSEVTSDWIPMMIDLDMVDDINNLLSNKKVWTKSLLWYDENNERIPGRKYVPVTIVNVGVGDIVFPVKVRFIDDNDNTGYMMMNMGKFGKKSRIFSSLFSLSDIRKRYPDITDENWKVICEGNVRKGMTKLECKLAIGNPSDVEAGRDYSQTLDLWSYPDGTVLWFEDGILTRFRR